MTDYTWHEVSAEVYVPNEYHLLIMRGILLEHLRRRILLLERVFKDDNS